MSFDIDDLKNNDTVANMRGRIPWLSQYRCQACGSMCTATDTYVESQASIMPVWVCESCGAMYHREPDGTR